MASMTIRNIDDDTKRRLRLRAARHGASMEEEVRSILRAIASADISVEEILRTRNRTVERQGAWESIRRLRDRHGTFDLPPPDRTAVAGDEPVFE